MLPIAIQSRYINLRGTWLNSYPYFTRFNLTLNSRYLYKSRRTLHRSVNPRLIQQHESACTWMNALRGRRSCCVRDQFFFSFFFIVFSPPLTRINSLIYVCIVACTHTRTRTQIPVVSFSFLSFFFLSLKQFAHAYKHFVLWIRCTEWQTEIIRSS